MSVEHVDNTKEGKVSSEGRKQAAREAGCHLDLGMGRSPWESL